MSRLARLHLASALYCGVLIALNWFRTTDYGRTKGLIHEAISPVAGALLIALALVVVLCWRALKSVRWRLETGERVPPGRWIESWSVMLYPLPLLWHQMSTSVWKQPDGTVVTAVGSFGSSLSSSIFWLAIVGLLLAQIERRLTVR